MSLTVEDRPSALLDLLWIREAHDLPVGGELLPPKLVDAPGPAAKPVDDGTRERWTAAWQGIWSDVLAHAATEPDQAVFDRVVSADPGSTEREALLRQLVGPTWRDTFGADVFDDEAYEKWERLGFEEHAATRPTVLAESPERREVKALANAWRRGLTKVVTIPCRGLHVQQIGAHALLVTDEVRSGSAEYRAALKSFGLVR